MNLTEELKHKEYYYRTLDSIIKKDKLLTDVSLGDMFNMDIEHKWSLPRLELIPKGEGKFRKVYAFNNLDKYYLKVINNIFCDKVETNDFVFSYKRGKCIRDAAKHLQTIFNENEFYVAKFDLRDYFGSVKSDIIFNTVNKLVEDEQGRRLLHELFSIGGYEYKGQTYDKFLSLIQGSPLSSFMSNYILKDIDDYMCGKCLCYSRYSDDIILVEKDRQELDSRVSELQSMLGKLNLELNCTKTKFYDTPDFIDYLGLRISRTNISITPNRRKKIKSRIKSVIRGINLNSNKVVYKRLYSKLYYNEYANSKYSGALSFVLMNITNTKDILDLDFYIKDTIRAKLTGHNNKANVKKYPNSWFEKTGYISAMTFYNMCKVSPNLMNQFIHNINKRVELTDIESATEFNLKVTGRTSLLIACSNAHKGNFILGTVLLDKRFICFDYINKIIRYKNLVLVKGTAVHKDLKFVINNRCYAITSFGSLNITTTELVELFLISSINDLFANNKFMHSNEFIRPSFKDIFSHIDIKDKYLETPRQDRVFLFMYSLYAYVVKGDLKWRTFDNLKFLDIRRKGKGFTLIGKDDTDDYI